MDRLGPTGGGRAAHDHNIKPPERCQCARLSNKPIIDMADGARLQIGFRSQRIEFQYLNNCSMCYIFLTNVFTHSRELYYEG